MTITIRGTVYDTATGNGVGGVPVSNGEAVIRTDSAGRYTLPVEPAGHRFITVTVPDCYRPQEHLLLPCPRLFPAVLPTMLTSRSSRRRSVPAASFP